MVHKTKKMSTSERMKKGMPIEVWESPDGTWRWEVYKKYSKDDEKPFARWFCKVKSPFTHGGFDVGDVYVKDIKKYATKVKEDGA